MSDRERTRKLLRQAHIPELELPACRMRYSAGVSPPLTEQGDVAPSARLKVAEDAHIPASQHVRKPRLLVLVVGETVRAQNWGLKGYHRQTTPALAGRDVINFSEVQACGTSTEVSLPCMFSVFGRSHYDKHAIRDHESLLDVLARAGVSVKWRDNQSGCKDVCDGVGIERMDTGIDVSCLRAQASQARSHDNLFHSVLGLFGVQTHAYETGKDIFAPCRIKV